MREGFALTEDLVSEQLVVAADDVVIGGNRYSLTGSGSDFGVVVDE